MILPVHACDVASDGTGLEAAAAKRAAQPRTPVKATAKDCRRRPASVHFAGDRSHARLLETYCIPAYGSVDGRFLETALSSTPKQIIVNNFGSRLARPSRMELREPAKGANVFRRLSTHRDLLGSFALVRGSPFDSVRLSQTSGTCMACRRSGVRIPLAPRFSVCLFEEKCQTIGSGSSPDLGQRQASHCCV